LYIESKKQEMEFMRERDLLSLKYYEQAKDALFLKDMKRAVCLLCSAFYLRATEENEIDIEFHDFFVYQFSRYLSGKKRIKVSLPEGDMISDLIRTTFEDFQQQVLDSPFNIGAENLWNLLKEVRIDFPVQNVPDFTA
jgi:hypothetical protein